MHSCVVTNPTANNVLRCRPKVEITVHLSVYSIEAAVSLASGLCLSNEIVGTTSTGHFGVDIGEGIDCQDCVRACRVKGTSADDGGCDDKPTDRQIADDPKHAGKDHRSPKQSSWACSEYREGECSMGTTKPASHLSNFDTTGVVQEG